jgi:2'-5' RNA ligase
MPVRKGLADYPFLDSAARLREGLSAMTRLFVALWPPPEVVDALSSLDRPALPGVRWSVLEQWMVKVRPLGHVNDAVANRLLDVLEAELDGAPAVECVLGPLTRRLGGQWLGAPVAGLDDLAAVVFDVTEGLVPVTHPQPFQADIVLARGRVPKELAGRPVEGSWTAHSIALVADRSSPRRPRYEDLGVIRLGD